MYKSMLFIRSNLKKSKGQTVAIAVLVLIAAIMLDLWLMLSLDYKANFTRCHDRLNAEHVAFTATVAADEGDVKAIIDGDSRTASYAVSDVMMSSASMPYGDGSVVSAFVFIKRSDALEKSVGKIEIVDEDKSVENGIYLPLLYKTDANAAGKSVKITLFDKIAEYRIAGFTNSVMMGSHNCGQIAIVMSDAAYADLSDKGYAMAAHLYSVRLKNTDDSESYSSMLTEKVQGAFPAAYTATSRYDAVISARYVTQGVFSAVVSIMALLVMLIAIIVLVSNIFNYIQVNMKNLGALKAIGYISRQIIGALVLQFVMITVAASIVGIALSYAIFPVLNSMMTAQTGIPYAMRFLFLPALLTLIIPSAVIALAVFLACLKIKKIEPIVALRNGGETKKAKRNMFALEKTKTPVNMTLALKTAFSSVKQNVTVIITMLVISLVVVFSAMMTTNIVADSAGFVDMLVGETADSAIDVNVSSSDALYGDLVASPDVERAYMFASYQVKHKGGSTLTATISNDFSKVKNRKMIVEGEFPKTENDIAIAIKYAYDKNIKVGDGFVLTSNGKDVSYKVCGFTQLTNQLGEDCLLSYDGYKRAGELMDIRYYVDLKPGADVDAFNKSIEESGKYAGCMTFNVGKIISGSMSVYVALMKMIVIAILLIAVLIVTFVLYLLVRTLLNNKKRDYGVLKSIGYTTGQLIAQTAMSFMPAVIISTVVGLIVGCLVINPLMSLFLSAVGIIKSSFTVPVGLVTGLGFGMIALSFGMACLLSLKVKKITPKELLMGE